jgi:hypothetical protein
VLLRSENPESGSSCSPAFVIARRTQASRERTARGNRHPIPPLARSLLHEAPGHSGIVDRPIPVTNPNALRRFRSHNPRPSTQSNPKVKSQRACKTRMRTHLAGRSPVICFRKGKTPPILPSEVLGRVGTRNAPRFLRISHD